ncbi:hypothetical protein BU24DRAFT_466275 [Aaosphaeria arxii CBS 175.79]|uniref:Uncharacterized protein n=1 Tax=Aaosphaeria arxii CBS 175.79 TaxID=1450172 RepID=A0A6A5XF70_9PLEO|nr:uncharacterized protein BU24DRAFT_466275 [Aaosphaeria arxii CBS 175.79]KAF2011583.1 hypothetical protein BU24DRAFT_466275 [Aaosphaeria arxii CBS 175.79]
MHFLRVASVALTATHVLAIPLASLMGSKHNLYLVTCTTSSDADYPLSRYTAVAYFANGPIELSQSLTQIGTVDRPAQPWEGTLKVAKLGKTSAFSSRIDADAAKAQKGSISGTAVLDNEDFVCFKDGQIAFSVTDDWSEQPYTCKTDYWCPSILV